MHENKLPAKMLNVWRDIQIFELQRIFMRVVLDADRRE